MKKFIAQMLIIILLGAFIGLIISSFQYISSKLIALSTHLFNLDLIIYIIVVIITIIIIIGLTLVNNKIKGYSGSGVVQFENLFDNNKEFNPLLMFIFISANTFIAFFSGFALGAEGPSIALAGSIGYYTNNKLKNDDKDLIMASCSAGFACAFVAPLAGIFHFIEENKAHLNLRLLLKGIPLILVATFISYFLYNHSMLDINVVDKLEYNKYYYLIILILVSILGAYIFKYSILIIKTLNNKYKFMVYLTPVLALIMLVLKRYYPLLTNSGSNFISDSFYNFTIISLILLFISRIFLTALGTNSNLSGGIVIPMIACGAILADIFTNIIIRFDPQMIIYSDLFKVILMLSLFTTVTRCPLTGIFLGLKCGSFIYLVLPLTIVIISSYLITKIFKFNSIYKALLKRSV